MNRYQTLSNTLINKGLIEIESDLQNNPFYTETEKRVIKLLIRDNVNTANLSELLEAKKIVEHIIPKESTQVEFYKMRLQKIIKALDNL